MSTEIQTDPDEPRDEWVERQGLRRRPWFRASLVSLGYLIASAVIYGNVSLLHLATRCVGVCGMDTKLDVWMISWMPYALRHGIDPLFHSTLINPPAGLNLSYVTTMPGPALLMTPITMAFGPLASINILLLVSPALAGWATYLLCNRVTKRFWPSVAGGLLFGFSTYMSRHMADHINLVLIFPIPLAAYLVVRRLEGGLGRRRFVVLLCLTLVAEFSISTEMFAVATLFGGFALLGCLAFGGKDLRSRVIPILAPIACAYLIVAILVSPSIYHTLKDPHLGLVRPLNKNSESLAGYALPRTTTLVGGRAFASSTRGMSPIALDDTAYLGPALLVMLLLFAASGRRERSTWLLLGFTAFAVVLSLGPRLYVYKTAGLPMPGAILTHLPLLQNALPDRFPLFAWLGIALAGSLWLARLVEGEGWVRRTTPWWRSGLVVVGAVMILPSGSVPLLHAGLPVPSFVSDGTYARYLSPGETILIVPQSVGDEVLWQARSDMYFMLARGYVGPFYAKEQGAPAPTDNLPIRSRMALFFYLQQHGVQAVVVPEPVPQVWDSFLKSMGSNPISVGGVVLYARPSGAWGIPNPSLTP